MGIQQISTVWYSPVLTLLISLNDHITNYGLDGIQQTIQILEENNIDYFGLGKIFYKKINNLQFAF